jgi:hypothetical protein
MSTLHLTWWGGYIIRPHVENQGELVIISDCYSTTIEELTEQSYHSHVRRDQFSDCCISMFAREELQHRIVYTTP